MINALRFAPNSYAALGRTVPPLRNTSSGRCLPNKPLASSSAASFLVTSPSFDALGTGNERVPIPLTGLQMGYDTRYAREWLTMLSRHLYDNNPVVSYAVDTIALYSTPLQPQASTDDNDTNAAYESFWRQWTRRCDYTGRFTWDAIQKLVCKALDVDGDIGLYITEAGGFPQVQVVEGWRIRRPTLERKPDTVDGVQIDQSGKVLGYWVEGLSGSAQILDATQFTLIYEPDRFSSYRGISPIRRGMNDVRDASDIKAFEKKGVKFASALAAVMEGDGTIEGNLWGNDDGNPPASDATAADKKVGIAELIGGDIISLPDGKKLQQLKNDRPGPAMVDFLSVLAGHFVSGLGIPPAFFLDEKLTGPNQRSVNGKAQRRFQQRQMVIAQLLEWIWLRVIGWGIAKGQLPVSPNFDRITIQAPAELTIDVGREMAQEREDVRSALMTRRDHFGNRGMDWLSETDQLTSEIDVLIIKAKALAKKHNLPESVMLAQFGIGYSPAMQYQAFGSAKSIDPEEEKKNQSQPGGAA